MEAKIKHTTLYLSGRDGNILSLANFMWDREKDFRGVGHMLSFHYALSSTDRRMLKKILRKNETTTKENQCR